MTDSVTGAKDLVPPEVRGNMKDVKHKIVVLSGKGGVGKTTVATNLAMSFAKQGLKSGILDVDIYGPNVPKLLGLEGLHPQVENERIQPIRGPLNLKVMSMGFLLRETDDAIAWRGPIVGKAIRQFLSDVMWGELDVLVVDLPPGTGDEILSILQSIPDIDGVIIISTPQEVAVLDARRAIRLVERMGVPVLGIVENMSEFVCPKCGEVYRLFGEGVTKKAAEDFGVSHLGSLPLDPRIIILSDKGIPFVEENPDSKAAKALGSIVAQISEMMGLRLEGK
ncbi:MAG: Mrp/NBP35 family ATP-binding protein [Candidatus Thorarchaeota archaeon]